MSSLPSVHCEQPHEGEVFAVFDLPPGPYPAPPGSTTWSARAATPGWRSTAPARPPIDAVGLFSVYPLEQNWNRGDREVVCIAKATSGTTTGSIKGGLGAT